MPSEAVDRVLTRLDHLDCRPRGSVEKGWSARCPAHEDRNPSFTLGQGSDGRALVWCGAGCTVDQIASALQLDVRDLFEPEDEPVPKREVVKHYVYTNAEGRPLFRVCRTIPKGFFQQASDGNGGWKNGREGVLPVLYNLPAVMSADRVVICEGEKDADALIAKGVVATTNPGGAGKWRDEYSPLFQGKAVAVIQDIDPVDQKTGKRPGQEHAKAVIESLAKAGVKAKLLEPGAGKDVSEHLAAGLLLGALREPTAPRDKPDRLEILSAREIMELPDPDESGYLLGPLLYRGHRIVVGGWTGHGKTTFTMHMVSAAVQGREFLRPSWHGRKEEIKALVVDVEQGTRTVKRVLREVGLDHADNVKYLRVPDGLGLDSDAEAIAFMEKTFATGRFDIVLCDPLYKCHRGDPNDTKAATELMRRFDDWRERYQFALVLPMHCRKPQGDKAPKLSPHDLFGSSAYQWGAEMLMGVERKSPGLTVVHWWKDREGDAAEDGAAVGSDWKVHFDRKRGFQRYVEGNQERLPINVAPTARFDLSEFCYGMIRESGGVSREEVKAKLHHRGIRWAGGMNAIDRALENLGHLGVISNGAPLKKDRVYQLQPELGNGTGPGAEPGPVSPTTDQKGGADQEVTPG